MNWRGINMETIIGKIEKNIPIPAKKVRWPYREMEVGDSILYTTDKNKMVSAHCACSYFKSMTKNKFTSAIVEDGIRIWRIK